MSGNDIEVSNAEREERTTFLWRVALDIIERRRRHESFKRHHPHLYPEGAA